MVYGELAEDVLVRGGWADGKGRFRFFFFFKLIICFWVFKSRTWISRGSFGERVSKRVFLFLAEGIVVFGPMQMG